MFKFTKSFVKIDSFKKNEELDKIKEIQKISQIHDQMAGKLHKQQENKPVTSSEVSKNIHRERVNSLRNIQKD